MAVHALLSFMDGFFGYNQIKMAPEDKTKTVGNLLLEKFDITYVTQKSVKGKIIIEQLGDAPTEDTELTREFPDEGIMSIKNAPSLTTWTMYFAGASNSKDKGIGIEACIAGLEAALSLEVQDLDLYGTNEKWLTKEDRLIPYHTNLMSLMKSFHNISFTYISRLRNRFTDALATLASMVDIPVGVKVLPLAIKRHVIQAYIHMVQISARCSDGKPWYFDIKNLISGRRHPPEASLKKERRVLQKLASRYVICGGDLYRRSFDEVQLLRINEDRAIEILEDVHSGVCGPHMNDKMLAQKNLLLGYF
ncbi:uncharacterized protein LOC143850280 [Tasmannia lanceolata]|uniref:uncharacterized protein LOC143850280 n=1 Tax=Tasmannia lanceolata TaxID=3420 RepID=UPI0040634A87